MSSVLANILQLNGKVATRAQLRALVDQLARTNDKSLTGKVRRAIRAMDKAGVKSARIEFDEALINKTFMPDSVKLSELEGLYGIEVHSSDLGEAKAGSTFFAEVSRRILEKINQGTLPWRMPWKKQFDASASGSLSFKNYVSGKAYKGVNFTNCMLFGQGDTEFITEVQAKERGGRIVNTRAWVPIAYFVQTKVTRNIKVKDKDGNEQDMTVQDVLKGMRWYKVYPLSATEDVKPIKRKEEPKSKPQEKTETIKFTPVKPAELIVSAYPGKPNISHGGDRAFYNPAADFIRMPPEESFIGIPEYYSTLFHELIHSTGHPKRLDRLKPAMFGTKTYAAEELVAELGASFLCAICKMDYFTMDNSAAYLKNWAGKLEKEIKNDKQFFVRQQFASLKAVRFMMGHLWKTWNTTQELAPAKKEPSKKVTKSEKPSKNKEVVNETVSGRLPVGFKGTFFGWKFTLRVQFEIDNTAVVEFWDETGQVVAKISGRKPVEREIAETNIWKAVAKAADKRDESTNFVFPDAQKRIKQFVAALYKDAKEENRRRAKLGSAQPAPVKTNKTAWAKYAAIIGNSQPARRVKKNL